MLGTNLFFRRDPVFEPSKALAPGRWGASKCTSNHLCDREFAASQLQSASSLSGPSLRAWEVDGSKGAKYQVLVQQVRRPEWTVNTGKSRVATSLPRYLTARKFFLAHYRPLLKFAAASCESLDGPTLAQCASSSFGLLIGAVHGCSRDCRAPTVRF